MHASKALPIISQVMSNFDRNGNCILLRIAYQARRRLDVP
jgi:hypothetical protein